MLNEMKSNSVNPNCREVLLEIGEILVGHSLLPFLDDPVGRNVSYCFPMFLVECNRLQTPILFTCN